MTVPAAGAPAPKPWLWLGLILAAAFALRMALSVFNYVSTFDSATPGLMAFHISRGESFPLFFYGQHYMGAIEAYVAAVFFLIFGPSDLSLSLSAILFSLGWTAGTYAVFSEIGGRRAGLVAAATTIAPPWIALWYNVLTYGGYTVTFCLGTWALWLCLRIARMGVDGRGGFLRIAALGLVAGLAMWTNYMSASFLLTGGLLVLAAAIRNRFWGWKGLRLAWAVPFFLAGVSPVIAAIARHGPGHTGSFIFNLAHIKHVIVITFLREDKGFGQLLFDPLDHAIAGYAAFAILFGGMAALSVAGVARMLRRRETPLLWIVPCLFAVVFFALYLPHYMAQYGTPRYLMPIWVFFFAAVAAIPVVAGPSRILRAAGAVLAGVAVAAFAAIDAREIARQAPVARDDRTDHAALVKLARDLRLPAVEMTGGPIWEMTGQVFSFYSGDTPIFSSSATDRYPPHALRLETELNRGFAVEPGHLPFAEGALKDLGLSFEIAKSGRNALIHDIKVPPRPIRPAAKAPRTAQVGAGVDGVPDSIHDRVLGTGLDGYYETAAAITVDLGAEVPVSAIWMMSDVGGGGKLPGGYKLESSTDGSDYRTLRKTPTRYPIAYTIGNRAYLRGKWGMMEIRLDPTPARFIRLTPLRGSSRHEGWHIGEMFIFQPADGPAEESSPPVADLLRALDAESIDLLVANRQLSARVDTAGRGGAKAPRVLDYHAHATDADSFPFAITPGASVAVAVESCAEPIARQVLEETIGTGAIRKEWRHGEYAVWCLTPSADTAATAARTNLQWTGRTFLHP